MSGWLTGFSFLHPWMLGALAALPVLWWLLRLMPPAPKHILFAPIRFLAGLIPERQTPSHTPWWILLLRCLIVALIILALAGPVRGPAEDMSNNVHIRLVIDNGWASASLWDQQMRRAEDLITRAGQNKQEIEITGTAPQPGQKLPLVEGPLSAGDAAALLRSLTPLPWPADNRALTQALTDKDDKTLTHTYWLGSGIDESGFAGLAALLQDQGQLFYYAPEETDLPVALKTQSTPEKPLGISVDVPGTAPIAKNISVEVLSVDGRVLDRQPLTTTQGSFDGNASFELPPDLRAQISRIQITGRRGAGSVLMMDDLSRRRSVGIVSSKEASDTKPFLDALFYLTRALSPYADLHVGEADTLLEQGQDVLIVTDDAALPPAVLQSLEEWMNQGGLILRFAGPNMTDGQTLTPVPLRIGQRALEGNLSWEKPQKLKEFPAGTPLADLPLKEDIIIKTQVLADPAFDLTGKIWASLEDGTPLITADTRGKGLLVMIHTAAGPAWSDLPLSGLYVQIMRRIIGLSGGVNMKDVTSGDLKPLSIMDGFGALRAPGAEKSIQAEQFADIKPDSEHPPGLYGRAGFVQALNLGDSLSTLKIAELPAGAIRKAYDRTIQTHYMPWLLTAAFILFLIDWVVLMVLSGSLRALKFKPVALIIFALICIQPAYAAESDDVKYAGDIYLAYVKSGQSAVDDTTQQGLETLSKVLQQRTSVEPDGVIAVDPENDDLSFFPIIYWPVSESIQPLSDKEVLNIQHYLDHGGTILFDTRGRTSAALQTLLHPLSIPALIPIEKDHVLNKTFYLINAYPGRYSEEKLWVEENSAGGRDGVSSIIIGSNDWASAWASPHEAGIGQSYLTGGTREQELALRFGINLVMYALTGNYKADQVHLPHILQRLDQ
jgi:hypothetical protein